MKNYKLKIQYDGTNYAGWQIQKNAVTVQEKIEDAIKILTKENINLIASGRTDAGVHALGQVANFRYEKELNLYKFLHSLNSMLPSDIAIVEINETEEKFHSRFDAKLRSYLYLICKIKSPFYGRFSIRKNNLDVDRLNYLSNEILGTKDFTSFCRKNSDVENKVCCVKSIHWRETKEFFLFNISADRFLHGMVRTIIGTLFYASEKKMDRDFIDKIFRKKNRESAAEAVPAKGLFLYKVKY